MNVSENKNEKKVVIKEKPKRIKLMALGGLGEVGKNCYVIEYERNLYIIDFGVIFPNKEQLKVDYIIPNYYYLKENEDRIKGLFITHGHEDHIGGIPFLLQKVKVKNIYAPRTAKYMIEKKFKEHKLKKDIIEIDGDSILHFGPVKVHVFRQAHSIPDAMGLFFETPAGNIVTTGDFKVDFSPPGQKKADFHKMTRLSEKNVLCLMSDSTNSMTEGVSLSESIVGRNLETLMHEAEGRIFYTTFASNINRVQEIIKAAKLSGKKIAITGRSLVNGLEIGLKTKYIKADKKDFIDLRDVDKYPPNRVCIIMTGSQGEELAALSRMANGLNVHITLNETDTVVFASNPIPGNNYQIGKVVDSLYKTKCKVIRNSDEFKTHASGHASKEEQKLMLSLFKPDNFAPIHGTHNMLVEHKNTASLLGMEDDKVFILNNGDVLEFINGRGTVKKRVVPFDEIHISGSHIDVDKENKNMYKLAESGILALVAYYDKRNKRLITYPQITTRGYIVISKSMDLMQSLQKIFIAEYNSNLHESINIKKKKIQTAIYNKLEKQNADIPLIRVDLLEFDKQFNKKNNTQPNITNKVKINSINKVKPKEIIKNKK